MKARILAYIFIFSLYMGCGSYSVFAQDNLHEEIQKACKTVRDYAAKCDD